MIFKGRKTVAVASREIRRLLSERLRHAWAPGVSASAWVA
jgi:hypothetical protein